MKFRFVMLLMNVLSGGDQNTKVSFEGCSIQSHQFPWQQTLTEMITRLLLAYKVSKGLKDKDENDFTTSLHHVEAVDTVKVGQF